MKKYFFLSAVAALALASCTSDEYLGDADAVGQTSNGAISFAPTSARMTRADKVGAEAAALLGENFVVEGIKGDGNYAGTIVQKEVFDHYNVNYTANTAHSTESNSSDWEYVGQDAHALSALGTTKQTIKYWDYAAKQYDYVAFSYGSSSASDLDLSDIDYTKLGAAVSTGTPVYTVEGSAEELGKAYIADLVTLYNRDGVSEFGTTVVTPKFRSLGTKVRLAFYEIVPGYSVKNVKFYNAAWDGNATSATGADNATLFAASAIFPSATSTGTMSVYFPSVGFTKRPGGSAEATDYNQATIKFTAGTGTDEELVKTKDFGALDYKAANEGLEDDTEKYLGRTSNTATYAGSSTDNYYEIVLPLGIKDDLQIRIEYDLIPTDGSEDEIHVRDARAVVPSVYADWKPNYAYTYIFKISDNTNGWTGVKPNPDYDPDDPNSPATIVEEGLTPITFDAVVVDSEDGVQETITSVATPSITTYAKGKIVTANDEYTAGSNIYVKVDGATTLSASNAKLYTATVESDALQGITEASVANALENGQGYVVKAVAVDESVNALYTLVDGTYTACESTDVAVAGTVYYEANANAKTVVDANGKALTVLSATGLSIVDKIDAADTPDGNAISGKFAKFTAGAAGTIYVFEYTVDATHKYYKVIKIKE